MSSSIEVDTQSFHHNASSSVSDNFSFISKRAAVKRERNIQETHRPGSSRPPQSDYTVGTTGAAGAANTTVPVAYCCRIVAMQLNQLFLLVLPAVALAAMAVTSLF